MESVYNMAKKYYPDLWSRARLDALLHAGKLTQEEYNNVVKEENISGNQNS